MSVTSKILPDKVQVAKVTSKGQVTIPVGIRRLLGAKAGDKLAFEPTSNGIKVSRQVDQSDTEIEAGGWLPPGYEGREGVIRYFRELRGQDETDVLIFGTKG